MLRDHYPLPVLLRVFHHCSRTGSRRAAKNASYFDRQSLIKAADDKMKGLSWKRGSRVGPADSIHARHCDTRCQNTDDGAQGVISRKHAYTYIMSD